MPSYYIFNFIINFIINFNISTYKQTTTAPNF